MMRSQRILRSWYWKEQLSTSQPKRTNCQSFTGMNPSTKPLSIKWMVLSLRAKWFWWYVDWCWFTGSQFRPLMQSVAFFYYRFTLKPMLFLCSSIISCLCLCILLIVFAIFVPWGPWPWMLLPALVHAYSLDRSFTNVSKARIKWLSHIIKY